MIESSVWRQFGRTTSAPRDSSPLVAVPLFLRVVAVGLGCILGNQIGNWLRFPEVGTAIFFPPYAVLAAALFVAPLRHWPAYLGAGFVAHFLAGIGVWPTGWVIFVDVANGVRAVLAAWALRRFAPNVARFDSLKDVGIFLLFGVVLAPLVAAAIGAAIVSIYSDEPYWTLWRAWFLSNALTGLVLLPPFLALLSARRWWNVSTIRRRAIEGVLLLGGLVVVSVISYSSAGSAARLSVQLYAPLPLLLWAATRFGVAGVSMSLLVVSSIGVWGAGFDAGPFSMESPAENLMALQLFLTCACTPLMCLAASIRERGRAEEALRRRDERYRLATAAGLTGVWDWSPDTNDLYVDPVLRRMLGFGEQEPLRDPEDWAARLHPDDRERVAGVLQAHIEGRTPSFEIEHRLVQRDGSVRWFSARGARVHEETEGPARLVGTESDITARKAAEHLAEEQRTQLAHLSRAAVLGELSGALAHELNQPLAAILINAETAGNLLTATQVDMTELRQTIRDIIAADTRAGEVIRRLHALLRRRELESQLLDVNDMIGEIAALVRSDLIGRRLSLTMSLANDVPRVRGDRVQLQQVLLNLVRNACDAMHATPDAERTVTIGTHVYEAGGVCVFVRDTGSGVPPEMLDRVFEPFFSSKKDGLGLGLTICRSIVLAHRGRLWASNNTGVGATFQFVLPAEANTA